MKKYLANIGLILGVGLLTLKILIGNENPTMILEHFTNLSIRWTLIGFACIGLYWGIETIIQYLLVERIHKGNKLWNSFKVVMSGHFFNAITPFASGGQPMQAFMMMKQGVPLGSSASVLLSKFIIYQLTLTLYSMIVLIVQLKFFVVKVKGIAYLSLVGFTVNLGVVIVLVMAAFMRKRTKKIGFWGINLLHKFHLIKDVYSEKKKLIKQVDLFGNNIDEMKKNKMLIARIGVLTASQLTAYFLIPYAVYRALD